MQVYEITKSQFQGMVRTAFTADSRRHFDMDVYNYDKVAVGGYVVVSCSAVFGSFDATDEFGGVMFGSAKYVEELTDRVLGIVQNRIDLNLEGCLEGYRVDGVEVEIWHIIEDVTDGPTHDDDNAPVEVWEFDVSDCQIQEWCRRHQYGLVPYRFPIDYNELRYESYYFGCFLVVGCFLDEPVVRYMGPVTFNVCEDAVTYIDRYIGRMRRMAKALPHFEIWHVMDDYDYFVEYDYKYVRLVEKVGQQLVSQGLYPYTYFGTMSDVEDYVRIAIGRLSVEFSVYSIACDIVYFDARTHFLRLRPEFDEHDPAYNPHAFWDVVFRHKIFSDEIPY